MVDVGFVFGSNTSASFQNQLDFTSKLLETLTISQTSILPAVVTLSNEYTIPMHFEDVVSTQQVKEKLVNLTYTDIAPDYSLLSKILGGDLFRYEYGARRGAYRVLLIFVDQSLSPIQNYELISAVVDIMVKGIKVVLVDIGPATGSNLFQDVLQAGGTSFSFNTVDDLSEDIVQVVGAVTTGEKSD